MKAEGRAFLRRLGLAPDARLGVALSGGGDSTALLVMLADLGLPLAAATVDHGLRPESQAEAEAAGRTARAIGVAHETLVWAGWDGRGNLMAEAREGRYRALGQWAARHGLAAVATGHTLDDQAETVAMRSARSAAPSALRGIRERATLWGCPVIRPLLDTTRATLRQRLRSRGIDWVEDPTNADERFERTRVRAAGPGPREAVRLAALAREAGRRHEDLLAEAAARLAEGGICAPLGWWSLAPGALSGAAGPWVLRLLLSAIAPGRPPPRFASLDRLTATLAAGRAMALGGVLFQPRGDGTVAMREPAAISPAVPTGRQMTWDDRFNLSFSLSGPVPPGVSVAPLGPEGVAAVRRSGQGSDRFEAAPGPARAGLPGIWRGSDLVAAPAAGWSGGWTATLLDHTPPCAARDPATAMRLKLSTSRVTYTSSGATPTFADFGDHQ